MMHHLAALALALVPSVATEADDTVDYPAILAQAVERYGLEGEDLASYGVDRFLDGGSFFRVTIGPVDLRLPKHSVVEKSEADVVRRAVGHTLDLLGAWSRWILDDPELLEQLEDDLETFRKWMKKEWKYKDFQKAADEDSIDLLACLGADEDVVVAAGRLAKHLRGVGERGTSAMILAPRRETFAELSTLFGALEPKRKKVLWDKEAVFHSAAWGSETHIVALEYAVYPWEAANPFAGEPLDTHRKTGFVQHCVERSAASVLRAAFNAYPSPLVEQALRSNLLIAVVGKETPTFSTWSFQFSRAGGSTQPYQRFVPGGNSAGGVLPPRKATGGPTIGAFTSTQHSNFREGDGEDHYLEALQDAQEDGLKCGRSNSDLPETVRLDRRAHFEITVIGKSESTCVSAPFLGEGAEKKKMPDEQFIDEYEEFFRSYRICFLDWLRKEGHPDGPDESPAAFLRFLRRLQGRGKHDTLEGMTFEVYGIPLSGPDGEVDSLEWRFLEYVAD